MSDKKLLSPIEGLQPLWDSLELTEQDVELWRNIYNYENDEKGLRTILQRRDLVSLGNIASLLTEEKHDFAITFKDEKSADDMKKSAINEIVSMIILEDEDEIEDNLEDEDEDENADEIEDNIVDEEEEILSMLRDILSLLCEEDEVEDIIVDDAKIATIEAKVTALIDSNDKLEAENTQLRAEIRQKDSEIAQLENVIVKLESEKSEEDKKQSEIEVSSPPEQDIKPEIEQEIQGKPAVSPLLIMLAAKFGVEINENDDPNDGLSGRLFDKLVDLLDIHDVVTSDNKRLKDDLAAKCAKLESLQDNIIRITNPN